MNDKVTVSGLGSADPRLSILLAAFRDWYEVADVALSEIGGGFSGAGVFKADLRNPSRDETPSGIYILKLSRKSEYSDLNDEYLVHSDAVAVAPQFSEYHIPKLQLAYSCSHSGFYVMLFDVAGRSLSQFSTSTGNHLSSIPNNAPELLAKLLDAWCDDEFDEVGSTSDALRGICGYRLDKEKAKDLHKFVDEYCAGTLFPRYAEVLVNPLKLCDILSAADDRGALLNGLMHGDLHGGNIMFHRFDPKENPFFVIDFALSRKGFIGFDTSYLELYCALEHLGRSDVAPLLAALKAVETRSPSMSIPPSAHWVASMLKALRDAQAAWQKKNFPNRVDDFDRQVLLSRVAAGINWANKNISLESNSLAICYAGWAARRYLEVHCEATWQQLGGFEENEAGSQNVNEEIWNEVLLQLKEFDERKGKYILVIEGMHERPELAALGQLPWSVVIDLDPNSDTDGVFKYAEPNISTRRATHLFTSEVPEFDPSKGTAWMLAGGWTARREFHPDFFDWRWKKLPVIRDSVRKLEEATRPDPIYCLVLTGRSLDQDAPSSRIDSIVKDIDEAGQGRVSFISIGSRQVTERARSIEKFAAPSTDFIEYLANKFGTQTTRVESSVPGPDGQIVTLPQERLRALEENLTILHSSLSSTQTGEVKEGAEFWRGRPPTWQEISSEIDIDRDVVQDIQIEAAKWLSAHRNHTIVVEHLPGSGGTTVSRRVAWNLRNDYPCVVVDNHSDDLGERIRDIFQLTESPIFVVAESHIVTETKREELYRYLSKNNVRFVMLYLRRNFNPSNKRSFRTIGYLNEGEVPRFQTVYTSLTEERYRQEQIGRISNNQTLERYRLPFFYGLIAFERNFLGLENYVERNIGDVSRSVRKVLEHIALASIFSNSGISKSVVSKLSGIDPSLDLSVDDLVGEGPASLLIEYGGSVRFLHQLIAEEVIEHFRKGISDNWRLDLKSYSIDFIEDIVEASGEVLAVPLFRQIFIDRSGSVDGVEDREDFSPIIESLDSIDEGLGQSVLDKLTEECPNESHFWSHLGRHQVYRMKRDYEKAEEYLQRAVSLSEYDPTHYHTLGLVIRSRLRNDLSNLPNTATVSEVFSSIDPLFYSAAEAFTESRGLSPDNVYGYVTHIQLITQTLKRMMNAAAVDSIVLVSGDNGTIATWIAERLSEAEELLRGATNLYSTLEPSNEHLMRRKAEMTELYGDIDRVIELWEIANARGWGANSRSRSALANAYLARADRKWRDLPVAEVQRISDLMSVNLRDSGRRSDDYLLWFMAFSSSPKFDYDTAVSNISLWLKRFPTWQAHYLLYLLRFLVWFEGRTQDTDEFKSEIIECSRLSHTVRTRSPIWFGNGISVCPIVHESDLGGWNRENGFWNNTGYLRRINGIVDRIDGPTSGSILIDGKISVFFSPGRDFSVYRSINEKVNFYLGFSPSGPRAWGIESGFVDEGHRVSVGGAPEGSELYETEINEVAGEAVSMAIDGFAYKRVLNFALEYIHARARLGLRVSSEELLFRVMTVTRVYVAPDSDVFERVVRDLEETGASVSRGNGDEIVFSFSVDEDDLAEPEAVAEQSRVYGKVKFYDDRPSKRFGFITGEDGEEYHFTMASVLPEFRKSITDDNLLISFFCSETQRGKSAQGITIVDGLVVSSEAEIPENEFREELIEFVFSEIDKGEPGSLSLSGLVGRIRENYLSGRPLEEILNTKGFGAFMRSIEGVDLIGTYPNIFVARSRKPVFGRVPLDRVEINRTQSSEASTEAFEAWLSNFLKGSKSPDGGVRLQSVKRAAVKHFDVEGDIAETFGAKSFPALIRSLPGFRVEGKSPNLRALFSESSGASDALPKSSEDRLGADASTEAFEAWLSNFLKGSKSPDGGVRLQSVKKAAVKHFDVEGDIAETFGAKSFPALIRSLPGFRVEGKSPNLRAKRV